MAPPSSAPQHTDGPPSAAAVQRAAETSGGIGSSSGGSGNQHQHGQKIKNSVLAAFDGTLLSVCVVLALHYSTLHESSHFSRRRGFIRLTILGFVVARSVFSCSSYFHRSLVYSILASSISFHFALATQLVKFLFLMCGKRRNMT